MNTYRFDCGYEEEEHSQKEEVVEIEQTPLPVG